VTVKTYEVRRAPSGRAFVVLGDAGDGSNSDNMYRYREPHTVVMELTGSWTGTKFNIPTANVADWQLVVP
jgi:hypothetical protein